MSWLGRIFRPVGRSEDLLLLKLRTTRFRQLLQGYGAFLSLLEDSAEKQGGSFILDRQYVVSLVEQVAEVADSVAFDLNVLTSQRNLSFYDLLERLRGELRILLAERGAGSRTEPSGESVPAVSPPRLAAALSRSRAIYRARGQVACRGIAAGRVFNLGEAPPGLLPAGCVLVAEDLPPGDAAFEAMGRSAALLLDRGGAAGPAARRARELHIPALVGLGDATKILPGGSEVTVDADENVVYDGRVPELLDYHLSTETASDEEPEYALLRSVRRAAFSLTLPADRTEVSVGDCRTFHDLVHLAQALAGDAMAELLATRCRGAEAEESRAGGAGCGLRLIRLERLSRPRRRSEARPADATSRPLAALLEGLAASGSPGSDPAARLSGTVEAVATEEHALAMMRLPGGFDLLAATVSAAAELNSVYARFWPRGEADPSDGRGALAAGLLARLGFTVTRTGRGVVGWLCGLPGPEMEERIRAVGRLRGRLAETGIDRGGGLAAEPEANALLGIGA